MSRVTEYNGHRLSDITKIKCEFNPNKTCYIQTDGTWEQISEKEWDVWRVWFTKHSTEESTKSISVYHRK